MHQAPEGCPAAEKDAEIAAAHTEHKSPLFCAAECIYAKFPTAAPIGGYLKSFVDNGWSADVSAA
jgi:hypothetical protein